MITHFLFTMKYHFTVSYAPRSTSRRGLFKKFSDLVHSKIRTTFGVYDPLGVQCLSANRRSSKRLQKTASFFHNPSEICFYNQGVKDTHHFRVILNNKCTIHTLWALNLKHFHWAIKKIRSSCWLCNIKSWRSHYSPIKTILHTTKQRGHGCGFIQHTMNDLVEMHFPHTLCKITWTHCVVYQSKLLQGEPLFPKTIPQSK